MGARLDMIMVRPYASTVLMMGMHALEWVCRGNAFLLRRGVQEVEIAKKSHTNPLQIPYIMAAVSTIVISNHDTGLKRAQHGDQVYATGMDKKLLCQSDKKFVHRIVQRVHRFHRFVHRI